jgi:hypothetical protein
MVVPSLRVDHRVGERVREGPPCLERQDHGHENRQQAKRVNRPKPGRELTSCQFELMMPVALPHEESLPGAPGTVLAHSRVRLQLMLPLLARVRAKHSPPDFCNKNPIAEAD